MGLSFLALVQQACSEMNITAPSSCIGNQDQQVIQLVALANAEGIECASTETAQGAWPVLRKTYTFNFVDGQQSYALPSDYDFMVYDTMWDTTQHWRVIGPVNPTGWNTLQYGQITAAAPFYRFKVEDNLLSIFPTPNSTDTIAFTYVSTGWCKSISGTPQSSWMADTDTYLLDDRLFVLGLKARFKQAKGLDYSAELALYNKRLDWAKANSGVAKTLNLSTGGEGMPWLSWRNLPDGNYGI